MYSNQNQLTVYQALQALEELSTTEAQSLPEGLSYTQLRNMRESVEAAQYMLNKLLSSVEQNMGWLEETESDSKEIGILIAA